MLARCLAIEIDGDQRARRAAAARHEDAVVLRAIVRGRAITRHQGHRAARCGSAVNAGVVRAELGNQVSARALLEHDGLPVGRETRPPIMSGLRRHIPATRTVGVDDADLAEASVGPFDIDQLLPVARPRRESFNLRPACLRQARWRAIALLHVKLAQAFESRALAIRRGGHIARHLRAEIVGRDFNLRLRRIDHHARVVDAERDDLRVAREINAADLPAGPEYDGFRIRCPVHARIEAVHGPCLLQVEIKIVIDPW
jgi:hypothetical protein